MKKLTNLLAVFVLLTGLAPAALAFDGARVTGNVTDANGAGVANATVRVVSSAGTDRRAVTNREGKYSIDGVPPGEYIVEVTAPGFRTATLDRVTVATDGVLVVDVPLAIAAVAEEVTVTASGSAQARDEVTRSIDVVTSADADTRGVRALPEALAGVAGVRIQRQGGPGSLTAIRFRGLRSQDTSVLVDDLRLRDASDPYGSFLGFFEDLTLTNLDRVEVVRGAGSTLYGSHAVGGVINLIPARGVGAPRFEASAEGGSLGTFRGRFSSTGGNSRADYSFGFDQQNVTNGVDGDDAYRNTTLGGRAAFRFNDRMELSGNVLFDDARVDLNGNPYFRAATPGGSVFAPSPVVFADAPNDPDDVRDSDFFSGSLRFHHDVNDVFSYTARYSGSKTEKFFGFGPDSDPDYYAEVAPLTFDYDGDGQPDVSGLGDAWYRASVHTVDVRSRFVFGPANVLMAGFEVEREQFRQDFPGPFGSSRQPFNAFGFDYDFDGINDASRDRQWTYAAFVFDQITLLDGRLQIGLGARWQGFRVGDSEALFGTSNTSEPDDARVQTVPTFLGGFDEKSAITGDGSIAYTFATTGTRLWAHVGNSFRAPSLYERFSNIGDSTLVGSGLVRTGDPTLKPELSLTVDGGIEQRLFSDRARVGATYFYTKLQRQIDFASFFNPVTFEADDPLGLGRFGGFVNTSGGLSRGVEVSTAVSPLRSLDVRGTYTFVGSDTRLPSTVVLAGGSTIAGGQSYRATAIPRHTFSLQATQRIGRLTLAFDVLAQSEHDAQLFESVYFSSRRFTFDGYGRANVVANYAIPVTDRVTLTLFGRVENFTDTEILENGVRAPGATAFGGVRVRF